MRTQMRTLGQERSQFALDKVIKNQSKISKDVKSFTAGAPTVILQNGFGQAMAFWLSKKKDSESGYKYEFVLESIKKWLIDKKFIDSDKNYEDFILKLSTMNQKEYLSAQKEALLLLEWIKRYASAFCIDEKNESGE
ncbi:MAG: type III-B CRISPR module-associated protein Cmr5 [bacterium]